MFETLCSYDGFGCLSLCLNDWSRCILLDKPISGYMKLSLYSLWVWMCETVPPDCGSGSLRLRLPILLVGLDSFSLYMYCNHLKKTSHFIK